MNEADELPQISHPQIAEAAAWVARLHGPLRSRAVERGVRRWLDESPEHQRAFELVTASWDETAALRSGAHFEVVLPNETLRPARPPGRLLPLAIAAVLLLAIVLSVVLQPRGAVATSVGEQRLLTLEDGSRVSMNTLTRLVVDYDKRARHVRLESGEAIFEVSKHAQWPFIVHVGDREVVALGTAFLVRHDDRGMAVALMEGSVAVSSARQAGSNQRIVLEAGERLQFVGQRAAPALDRPVIEKLTAWQRGQVPIDDLSLADAIAEMNRYSTVRLQVRSSRAAQPRVSGIFRAADTLSFARAVASSYGLLVVEEPGLIVLAGEPVVQRDGELSTIDSID